MLNILKDEFYYKKLNAADFINLVTNNYYIDLAMYSAPLKIIKDESENFIFLKSKYQTFRFTFSDNLDSKENKIIDIREAEVMTSNLMVGR